jgi:hypothetical protein
MIGMEDWDGAIRLIHSGMALSRKFGNFGWHGLAVSPKVLCPKQTGYCPIRHIRMGLMYGFHEGITNYAESLMRNHRSLAIMGKAIASAVVQFQVALIDGDR